MSFLSFLFGNKDKRILRQTNDLVTSINLLEKKFEELDSEELKNTTQRLKDNLADGKKLDDLIPEAFAAVRESSKRYLGLRHYDCQLIGGVVLNKGMIAFLKH